MLFSKPKSTDEDELSELYRNGKGKKGRWRWILRNYNLNMLAGAPPYGYDTFEESENAFLEMHDIATKVAQAIRAKRG